MTVKKIIVAGSTALSLGAFPFQDWVMAPLDFQDPRLRAGRMRRLLIPFAKVAAALPAQALGSLPDLPHLSLVSSSPASGSPKQLQLMFLSPSS